MLARDQNMISRRVCKNPLEIFGYAEFRIRINGDEKDLLVSRFQFLAITS